ncbi:hypothetical protein GMMP15_560109 [Candidatus Magnetomoraceae bacterium gMMP-15]
MSDKVVFVDDESRILKVLKRLFMDEPYEIFTFESPINALEQMKKNEIAVVVSDQRMPDMKGTEFLEKVRENWPDTVRIILTGYADLEAAIDSINKGYVYRFINKPWDDTQFKMEVEQAVDHYKLVVENKMLLELTRKQNEELTDLNKNLENKVEQRTKKIRQLLNTLKKSFYQLMMVFIEIMEQYEPALGSHSKRVAGLAKKIAKQYDMNAKNIELIEISALLHDIGMICLPKGLLEKDEQDMSKSDIALIQQHPILGHSILSTIERFKDVSELVYCHHENFDGSGYPNGIKKDMIHIGARIIRVANDYDNLIKRNKMSSSNALEHIKERSGYEYDPKIVAKLLAIFGRFKVSDEKELAFKLDDLKPGMVLSRNLKTHSGRLLLPINTLIQAMHLERLKRFNTLEPIVDRIYVHNTRSLKIKKR